MVKNKLIRNQITHWLRAGRAVMTTVSVRNGRNHVQVSPTPDTTWISPTRRRPDQGWALVWELGTRAADALQSANPDRPIIF